MGLFSSIRIAPGVRISTSSRGPRVHVGPRLARVHAGGGRSGVSTGAGPFTLYGGSRASAGRRSRGATSTSGMTPKQAERAEQVDAVRAAWLDLDSLHRTTFPDVTKPAAVKGEPVPMFAVLLRRAERDALTAVGRRDRDARKQAKAQARERAETEAMELLRDGVRERDERQEEADLSWASLVDGEPQALRDAVAGALEARGLDVTVASDARGVVIVEVQLPGDDHLPTHWPSTTPTGLPTLKKLTKTESAQHFRTLVGARVLLVAKEAFAQSTGLTVVHVAGIESGRKAIIRTSISRSALARASWDRPAWDVLEGCDPALEVNIGGRTQELRPLSSRSR